MNRRISLFLIITLFKTCMSALTPEVSITEISPGQDSPYITKRLDGRIQIIALMGSSLVLECQIKNKDKDVTIKWTRYVANSAEAQVISVGLTPQQIESFRVSAGNSLDTYRIEAISVNPSYEGLYRCEASFTYNSQRYAERYVKIYQTPTILTHATSYELERTAGEDVTLKCAAAGLPKPLISWRRTSGASSVIRGYGYEVVGNSIVLKSVQASDRGTYRCEAVNEVGRAVWLLPLNIRFAPQLSFGAYRDTVYQRPHYWLEVRCKVEASPAVAGGGVTWQRVGGGSIGTSGRVRSAVFQGTDHTTYAYLLIEPVLDSDYGRYACSAANEVSRRAVALEIELKNDNSHEPIAGRYGVVTYDPNGAGRPVGGRVGMLLLAVTAVIVYSSHHLG